jgi:hypothetical protein
MWMRYTRRSPITAGILLLLLASQSPTFARGSQVGHEIPGIRNVSIVCRPRFEVPSPACAGMAARAAHYFATFFDNSRVIKLHFEHLHCDEQARFCRGTSCLRQEYISTGGHYRLQRSYYGRDDDWSPIVIASPRNGFLLSVRCPPPRSRLWQHRSRTCLAVIIPN